MKFEMNNREWYIEEVDIKTIREEYNKWTDYITEGWIKVS